MEVAVILGGGGLYNVSEGAIRRVRSCEDDAPGHSTSLARTHILVLEVYSRALCRMGGWAKRRTEDGPATHEGPSKVTVVRWLIREEHT